MKIMHIIVESNSYETILRNENGDYYEFSNDNEELKKFFNPNTEVNNSQ